MTPVLSERRDGVSELEEEECVQTEFSVMRATDTRKRIISVCSQFFPIEMSLGRLRHSVTCYGHYRVIFCIYYYGYTT